MKRVAIEPVDHMHMCPACGEGVSCDEVSRQSSGGGFLTCLACKLSFAEAMPGQLRLYDRAYNDDHSELALQAGYTAHMAYGSYLLSLPDVSPCLTHVEHWARTWITRHIAPGAVIIDVGCGVGRFMMCLRQAGYNVYGMDVAAAPVTMLERAGYHVAQGTPDLFPEGWPAPALVTCFEVMEHLAEPVRFLNALRTRFPTTPLMVVVPDSRSRSRHDLRFRDGDCPPNHLTRWSKQALRRVLYRAGYDASIQSVHVAARELEVGGPTLRKIEDWLFGLTVRLSWFAWRLGLTSRLLFKYEAQNVEAKGIVECQEIRVRGFWREILQWPWWIRSWIGRGSCYWFAAIATEGEVLLRHEKHHSS